MSKEIQFTQGWVEHLKPSAERITYRDAKTVGLVLVVQPSGTKTFAWYRKCFGCPTWKNVGDVPDFGVQDARAQALEWNANLAKGNDPFIQRGAVTLGEAFRRYCEERLAEHAKNPGKAILDAGQQFDANLGAWRDRKLDTIKDTDVATAAP
jgi:hypothetical protein